MEDDINILVNERGPPKFKQIFSLSYIDTIFKNEININWLRHNSKLTCCLEHFVFKSRVINERCIE